MDAAHDLPTSKSQGYLCVTYVTHALGVLNKMHALVVSDLPPPTFSFLISSLIQCPKAQGSPSTYPSLEMTLLNARDLSVTHVDDQSTTARDNFVGTWTTGLDSNYTKYYRGTYTATSRPGDSFSFTFTGTQAWLYGGLFDANVSQDGRFLSYPTAHYLVDDEPVGPKAPYFNSYGEIVYFRTESLPDGPHKVNLTVTTANQTNPFIVDSYVFTFSSNTSSSPSPKATHPGHVGAIVGGVVGGLAAIAILVASLLCFMRKRRGPRGDQNNDFERPSPVYAAPNNYPIEPFDPAPDMTQHTSSDYSNLPSGSSFRPSGIDSFQSQSSQPGGMTQTSTRKAVLIAQSSGNVPQPIQHNDSGIRFSPVEGEEPARPQSPPEIPPTYTYG